MKVSEFSYNLPRELIAQEPLEERDASRLLLVDRGNGAWQDRYFRELPELLRADDLVIVNNARVMPVRLLGRRLGLSTGRAGRSAQLDGEFLSAEIEVLLLR